MSDDQRLARIENKLDDMAKAIVLLARMEERMVTLFNRMDNLDSEQTEQGKRLRAVESNTGTNGQALRFAERLFWITATSAVGLIFYKIRSGG